MKVTKFLLGAALLAVSAIASAMTISVSDISITSGSYGGLRWTTTEADDFSFYLDGRSTQTYGTFTTADFPINYWDDVDSDYISASFYLSPPGATAESQGRVTARGYFSGSDRLSVNFDNTWLNMGDYEVRFRDLSITSDGTYDLTARFRSVPEPATLALLGLGLLGLGFARRVQNA